MGKAAVSTTALTANTKTRVAVRIRFSLILSFRFFEGPGDTEIVANLIHLGCQEIILRPSWLQPPHSVGVGEAKKAKDDGRLPMEDHNTRIIVFGRDGAQAKAVAEAIAREAFDNVSYFSAPFERLRTAVRR